MQTNDLQLRSVNQLLKESFYIPAYQRGYRWTVRQVTDLLEDVLAFIKEGRHAKGEFYCLQPVVIAQHGQRWELIDGQQRLTTIFLVLSYFNNRRTPEFRTDLFSLAYETRERSAEYLRTLNAEERDSNIDFFHIWMAYQAIIDWFKDRAEFVNDVESAFLRSVKVIWYEVRGDVDPIAVFTRLNIGKIPLTNAELVKALFLRASNFEREEQRTRHLQQLKIAQEWDEIERRLQDDAFWFFLGSLSQEASRIDFVLTLRALDLNVDPGLRGDRSFLFLSFSKHLPKGQGYIAEEWDAVKRVFLQLDEWFKDHYLYHVIGFLLTLNTGVNRVRKLAQEAESKTAFRESLKDEIFRELFKESRDSRSMTAMRDFIEAKLAKMDYLADRRTIFRLLLLFNIVSLLGNAGAGPRFPFDRFKKDQWDLEHVRSVKSDMPERKDDQKAWASSVLEYLSEPEVAAAAHKLDDEDKSLVARLRTLRETEPFDSHEFESVFEAVIERYDPGSDAEADHSIGNLTLLDAGTNRSYGNAIFPLKRRKLIALDRAGKFIPPCTKNAFFKYYSAKIDEMLIWTRSDAADHQAALVDALAQFFVLEGA
ncbi:DUF262 domain-containing protein [Ralstonia sp.]|uniref:DUF262 domain-containing protein n=1 Tax=Ralstonia sp. TaxID=54061 RepID=UPI0031D2C298